MEVPSALLGVVIGAILGGLSNVGLEIYKRHRDKKTIASLLAGELSSLLDMTDKRNYKALYKDILVRLEEGGDVAMPDVLGDYPSLDPGLEKVLVKVGMLPGDLPERIARFYQQLGGVRLDMKRLGQQTCQGNPAVILREDLSLWEDTEQLGRQLVADLRKTAGTGHRRLASRW